VVLVLTSTVTSSNLTGIGHVARNLVTGSVYCAKCSWSYNFLFYF
jgi:hypothetical protein